MGDESGSVGIQAFCEQQRQKTALTPSVTAHQMRTAEPHGVLEESWSHPERPSWRPELLLKDGMFDVAAAMSVLTMLPANVCGQEPVSGVEREYIYQRCVHY